MHKSTTKRVPAVYGYVADSAYDDNPSAEEQIEQIEARSTEIGGELARCFIEKGRGPEDPFQARPEFQALLSTVREGEHIIVARLAVIDSNPHRLDDALKLLVGRVVHVHSVAEEGGEQLDLDPQQVRMLAFIWHLFRRMRVDHIGTTTRRALRTKKATGQVYHRNTPFGKKRVRRKVNGCVEQYDVWDETECRQIREIHRRKTGGESFRSIAEDFYARKLKKADGRPWVTRPKWKKRLNISALQRAFEFYTDRLDRGLDLGMDDT